MKNTFKRPAGLLVAGLLLAGVAYSPVFAADTKQSEKPKVEAAKKTDAAKKEYSLRDLNEQLIMATLWVQTSAEYRALCRQTYNTVRMALDKDLAEVKTDKKRIIILDGDETTLQANLYEAYIIGIDKEYPVGWYEWVADAKSIPIPGAAELLNYAASKGVEPYYVTNRKIDKEYQGTLDDLKKNGFPFADPEHVVYRQVGQPDNKLQRQLDLVAKYHLVAYVGDDLNDFPLGTHGKTLEERNKAMEDAKDEWGRKYFMLPNPMYGSWEKTLKNNKVGLPAAEQDQMRRAYLRRWEPSKK